MRPMFAAHIILPALERALAGHADRAGVRAVLNAVERLDGARGADFALLVQVLELEEVAVLPSASQEVLFQALLDIDSERRGRTGRLRLALVQRPRAQFREEWT